MAEGLLGDRQAGDVPLLPLEQVGGHDLLDLLGHAVADLLVDDRQVDGHRLAVGGGDTLLEVGGVGDVEAHLLDADLEQGVEVVTEVLWDVESGLGDEAGELGPGGLVLALVGGFVEEAGAHDVGRGDAVGTAVDVLGGGEADDVVAVD